MLQTMSCQQIVAKLVAELDGDVCESAFVVDEESEVLIDERPFIFFLVGNLFEIRQKVLAHTVLVEKAKFLVNQ